MLKSLVPFLRCPVCLKQDTPLELHVFVDGEFGHVRDGILNCPSCRSWYLIENELLELVRPELRYQDDYIAFTVRFRSELEALRIADKLAPGDVDISAQQVQRKHFDWYAGNEAQTYNAYQKSPFWTAFDAVTFAEWKQKLQRGGLMLDVGCADGRSSFPFIDSGTTIVGFDISKALVRQAIRRAADSGAQARTTFFVGDATALPFRDGTLDHVVIYGVLHHVPNPAVTCREVYRVLKPGGIYFGSENNVTVFRGIFDLLMKLRPIWTEEAGDQPLISLRHIQEWLQGRAVSIKGRSSVFVPPQLVNLAGHRSAQALLSFSDKLFKAIPGMQNQGGLIVFEVKKQA